MSTSWQPYPNFHLANRDWELPPHVRDIKCEEKYVSELTSCLINWDLSKVSQSAMILWNEHVMIFYIYIYMPWYPNPAVTFIHSFIHLSIHPPICSRTQSIAHLLKAYSVLGIMLGTDSTKIVDTGSWPLWNLQQNWKVDLNPIVTIWYDQWNNRDM